MPDKQKNGKGLLGRRIAFDPTAMTNRENARKKLKSILPQLQQRLERMAAKVFG